MGQAARLPDCHMTLTWQPDPPWRVDGLPRRGGGHSITFRGLAARRADPYTVYDMSIDKSLKRKGGMTRPRCVLTRGERILKMMEDGRWTDGRSPFGLPKVRVQKVVMKKKPKKEAAEGDAAAAAPGAAP